MKIEEVQNTEIEYDKTLRLLWKKTNSKKDLSSKPNNLFPHQNCKCINFFSMPLSCVRISKCCSHNPQCVIDTIRCFALQFMNKESQEVVIGFLLLIGLWTSIKWAVNIVFSLMWPLFFVMAMLLAVPSWREYITDEYLHDNFLDCIAAKLK